MVFFRHFPAVTAAISLLAFKVAATEPSGEVVARGLENDSTLVPRKNADCEVAQYMWADVDCYYDFDKGGNFLNYVIRIEPTGQSNSDDGWCKGIMDNIFGECGRNPDGSNARANDDWSSCKDYLEYKLHNPITREHYKAKGIDMNFHYVWPWKEGEDATKCIESAVKKAVCQKDAVKFKKGGCYKRRNV